MIDKKTNKSTKSFLKLPNHGEIELDYLIDTVTELKKSSWTLKKWTSRPALIDKSGGSAREYTGQSFDKKYIDLVENGWTHDHCEICTTTISEGETSIDFEIEGYNHENRWICKSCFDFFLEPVDLIKALEKLERIDK